jgi:O-acetyl-ADP-ribose deacetylase (regulator of RNase III)
MAVIEPHRGDLLRADADALVNTVNTVGVMGKGIALQFRKAFPANYEAYRRACEAGSVQPGKMLVFETGQLVEPRLIINFPTKRHWRGRTRIEDIDSGLEDLVAVIDRYDVRSIAIPPLGCGNGGLAWSRVRPMIEAALAPLPSLRVLMYAPDGPPPAKQQRVGTPAPRMTHGRAALLLVLDAYRSEPGASLTLLVAQKMAYFLQVAGQPLRLRFVKGQYGPYAETLNQVLQRMDGHFITGYGDRTTRADIQLDPTAVARARAFLAEDPRARDSTQRVSKLIEGFESPFGLELLATVHWASRAVDTSSPDDALQFVEGWTPRKRKFFQRRHVEAAWERLQNEGWLASPS